MNYNEIVDKIFKKLIMKRIFKSFISSFHVNRDMKEEETRSFFNFNITAVVNPSFPPVDHCLYITLHFLILMLFSSSNLVSSSLLTVLQILFANTAMSPDRPLPFAWRLQYFVVIIFSTFLTILTPTLLSREKDFFFKLASLSSRSIFHVTVIVRIFSVPSFLR